MANEAAVNIELPKIIVNRICAEATAIPLGTVMKLSGTNTAAASSADNDIFAGITVEEFKGGEGLTHVACAMDGVWDMAIGAATAIGLILNITGANQLGAADAAALLTGSVCGKLEEATGGAAVARVRVGALN